MSQPTAPPPSVPYGPGPAAPVAEQRPGVPATVARTAVTWGVRLLLPLLVRAVFRALARR